MSYHDLRRDKPSWDERNEIRLPHARPRWQYNARVVLDAVLLLLAITVLVIVSSTGYAR